MATKRSTRKKVARRRTRPAKAAPPTARRIRDGFISHTELVSEDPGATKRWCETVLGWKFAEPMPTPTGPYEMWSFGGNMGGGIRAVTSGAVSRDVPLVDRPEAPGTIPYCEVSDIREAYRRALEAGAMEMMSPGEIPGGNGWLAIVRAPGGVTIGFWGPK